MSRDKYSTSRAAVEEQISKWTGDYIIQKTPAPQPILYDAKCQKCGKEIKVPFKPDGVRPVYCKSCLRKDEFSKPRPEEKIEEKEEIKTVSLEDLLPKKIKKQRKPVSKINLKKALEEALKREKDDFPQKTKKGIIKPGEIIKF